MHPSTIFYICPNETPEGAQCGIVKNFSLLTTVSDDISTAHVKNILNPFQRKCEILPIDDIHEIPNIILYYTVFINGSIYGYTKHKTKCVNTLKRIRDVEKLLEWHVSISYDDIDREIHIFSDEGRLLRPLLKVNKNKISLPKTWNNTISYIDAAEVENNAIAMHPRELQKNLYTYCEIHPSLMLGIATSIMPYSDHTPSPRVIYQSNMIKQSLGIYSLSNELRVDTRVHMLHYPQKPLVSTKYSNFLGLNDLPSGINCVVAIACYTGFNQEDSIIMNKNSIERGLFCSTEYRTITINEYKKNNYTETKIGIPPLSVRNRMLNYRKLGQDGIIKPGSFVNVNDVIVGKYLINYKKTEKIQADCSEYVKKGEEGIIDKVFTCRSIDGYKIIKIKIRHVRRPRVGDKFDSRSAQKGTIGMIYSQEDMPFTKCGMTPDIIMNAHAIPSRMTISQLLETLSGKISANTGKPIDSTPFTKNSHNIMNSLCDQLHSLGFERHANEVMYNGFTGEKFDAQIFMGPTYYTRLKHLVACKIHARDYGAVQSLTRQPTSGRSRDGGLRFGEMEKDCMIAHGCAQFLKERLYDLSDPFQISVCPDCCVVSNDNEICQLCHNDCVKLVEIPYACKLLFQLLEAMHIKNKIKTK